MTLLEIMLVMVVAGAMSISKFQEKLLEFEQTGAKQLGVEIFQYNNGVRRFLAAYKPDPTAIAGGKTHEETFEGVTWLKSSNCGVSTDTSDGFIDCGFAETTNMGRLHYITKVTARQVTNPGDAPRIVKSAKTIVYPTAKLTDGTPLFAVPVKGSSREDLAGVAAMVASGGTLAANVNNPTDVATGVNSDGYTLYCTYFEDPTIVRNECKDKITSAANGEIEANGHLTMFVSNNTVNDIWIRQDGGNKMKAHFDMDETQNLAIRGVSAIVPKGGELTFTDKTDLSSGEIKVHGKLTFLDDIVSSTKLTANNLEATNITATNITTSGNTVLGNSTSADKLTVNAATTLNGKTTVNGAAVFKNTAEFEKSARFQEKATFFKGLEVMEDATYNGNLTVKGILNAGDFTQPVDQNAYSVLALNGIKAGAKVVAPMFTDQDKDVPDYYLKPSADSVVKEIKAETLSADDMRAGTYRFIDPSDIDADTAHWGLDKDTVLRYYSNMGDSGNSTQLSLKDGLIHNIGVVSDGQMVTKPNCPGTDLEPAIYTSLAQITSDTGNPLNPYAIQTYAESVDATKWRVRMRYHGPDSSGNLGWRNPAGEYSRIQVITKCVFK